MKYTFGLNSFQRLAARAMYLLMFYVWLLANGQLLQTHRAGARAGTTTHGSSSSMENRDMIKTKFLDRWENEINDRNSVQMKDQIVTDMLNNDSYLGKVPKWDVRKSDRFSNIH